MKLTFLKGVTLGALVAVIALLPAAALAGTGIGGIFNLGTSNSVNATSTITGATAGRQLQVTNTSTGSGATGVGITVASGKPPLTVNSNTQVANLNATYLQGKTPGSFLAANGTAVNSTKLGGLPASSYVTGGPGSLAGVPGFVSVSVGSSVFLGRVGNMGSLNGYCGFGGFTLAAVTFTASNPAFYWASTAATSGYGWGTLSGGSVFNVTPDTNVDTGTTQVASANETATIHASQNDDGLGTCTFAVQAVVSGG